MNEENLLVKLGLILASPYPAFLFSLVSIIIIPLKIFTLLSSSVNYHFQYQNDKSPLSVRGPLCLVQEKDLPVAKFIGLR